jgi:ABC-type Fe3+-hydroxamate transport system substrate-binding protein
MNNQQGNFTNVNLSRRHFLQGAGGALMGATLAGCVAVQSVSAPNTMGATPAATMPEMRTITDMAGREVEIPVSPERVVFMNDRELASMAVTLGYVPFGIVVGDLNYIERLSSVGGPQGDLSQMQLLSVNEPDIEAIAAAKPDLIFQDSYAVENQPDELAMLEQIAPVVAISARKSGVPRTAANDSRHPRPDRHSGAAHRRLRGAHR